MRPTALLFHEALSGDVESLKARLRAMRTRKRSLKRNPSYLGGRLKPDVRQEIDRLETEELIIDLVIGRLSRVIEDVREIELKISRVPEELRSVKEIREGRFPS